VNALLALAAGWRSQSGRRSTSSSPPGAWTAQSHVNRTVERGTSLVQRYLGHCACCGPRCAAAARSSSAAARLHRFQTADGPLLRWAYRGRLRSYFLMEFAPSATVAAPKLACIVRTDSLVECRLDAPLLKVLRGEAMVSDGPGGAGNCSGCGLWGRTRAPPRTGAPGRAGRWANGGDAGPAQHGNDPRCRPRPRVDAAMRLVAGATPSGAELAAAAVPGPRRSTKPLAVGGALAQAGGSE